MKITKSELKEMIREALREELNKKVLKETFEELDYNKTDVTSCLARVNSAADAFDVSLISDNYDGYYYDLTMPVHVTEEDLKKILRLGLEGEGHVVFPAQLVDRVCLQFLGSEYNSYDLNLQVDSGDGDEIYEYLDENVATIPFVCYKELNFKPTSDEEAFEYFKNEIVPNATNIVHQMVETAWKKAHINDYKGITTVLSLEESTLKKELEKTDDKQIIEAAARTTITAADIRNISIQAKEFAVMTDPDNEASFCSYDFDYDELFTGNFSDELEADNIFNNFGDAANFALLCAKKDRDLDFFIVSFDNDFYYPEAHITCKINGYNWFSRYDSATDTWSKQVKIRG
jgi:hypothetical protein